VQSMKAYGGVDT